MASDKITPAQILFPVALLSFVVVLSVGFQSTLMFKDRDSLNAMHAQQDKPLEQVEKIKTQVNALAIGTLKLAQQGNKDAENIIAELKKAGVDVSDQAPGSAVAAPPAAMTPPAKP